MPSSSAQQALDISTALIAAVQNGAVVVGSKDFEMQVLACLSLLAEGQLGQTPSTESIDGGGYTQTDVSGTTSITTPQG